MVLWILRRSTSTLVLSHRRRRRCRHLATARHGVPGLPQLAHRIPAPDVAPRSRVRNASAERNSAGNTLGIGPIITIRGLPRHALPGHARPSQKSAAQGRSATSGAGAAAGQLGWVSGMAAACGLRSQQTAKPRRRCQQPQARQPLPHVQRRQLPAASRRLLTTAQTQIAAASASAMGKRHGSVPR